MFLCVLKNQFSAKRNNGPRFHVLTLLLQIEGVGSLIVYWEPDKIDEGFLIVSDERAQQTHKTPGQNIQNFTLCVMECRPKR